MKKKSSFLSTMLVLLVLIILCKTAGETKVKVTKENVTELFNPSLECYVYYMGSYFYDVEKFSDGNPRTYGINNGYYRYKVVEYQNADEIRNKIKTYLSDDVINFDESFFNKENDDLYISVDASGTGSYDMNSIELINTEENRYYISVDYYGNNTPEKKYTCTKVFITELKDGVLFIEELSDDLYITEKECLTADPSSMKLISELDKFINEN